MQTPVPYAGVVELLRALAGALDQAHSAGIAHGGLRPEAIHINTAGKPVLTDFGLQIPPVLDSRTARPSVIGTAAYMSVEQRHDDPATDGRADQYALAVIAYELLRGARTWRVNSDGVLEIDPIEVMLNRPIAPGVPVAAGMSIRRASSRDANYRYPTIGDFLRAFEGEKPAETSTAEPLYHEQVVVSQRHSRLWLAVPALLVAAVGFSTQPSVRAGVVRLWHGEWPFARAEYLQDNSVTASGGRQTKQVAGTESRENSTKKDSSGRASNTRVGDAPNTPQRAEDNRNIDPYPKTKTTRNESPNSPVTGESQRVNPPKSDPPVVAAATGGAGGGDGLRSRASAALSNASRDSVKRSSVSSIAVVLDDGGRAIVLIDGQPRGTTPLVWQGAAGQHVVTLRGVTTTPASISLDATAGDTVRAVFSRSRP
jgi:serine/threonine protein kinase